MVEIDHQLAEHPELKRSDLVKGKIRAKKLKKHLVAVMSIISKLNDSTSKAILYRQNWIGRLLQE